MQVDVLRRNIGQTNIGADELGRRGVLIGKGHAVERGVLQPKLHRERRGRGGVLHLRGRFGLRNADSRAPQRRVIHLVDGLIHIHRVHIGRELADSGPHVGAGYLVVLGEVDIGEPGLADVVFQGRSRGVLRRVRVDKGVDDEVVVVHRIGLGAREAHAAVVQLHVRHVNLLVQQRPDVDIYAQVAHREQRVAPLVRQVHAVEVDSVAEIGAKLPDAYFRLKLFAQVAFGPAGHKILPGGQLQQHYHRNNEHQQQGEKPQQTVEDTTQKNGQSKRG